MRKKVLIIILIISLLILPVTPVSAGSKARTLKELRAELQQLKNKKASTQNQKQQTKNQISSAKNNIANNYLNNNLIDDKSFDLCIQFMNDIFNYYISGYPDIPDEFLFNKNDNN